MYPGLCDATIAQKTAELLATHPQLPATVIKPLRVGKQEEERCVRARAKSLEAAPSPSP